MDSRFSFLQFSCNVLSKCGLERAGSYLGRDIGNPDDVSCGFPQSPGQMLNAASFDSQSLPFKSFPAPHSLILLPFNTI